MKFHGSIQGSGYSVLGVSDVLPSEQFYLGTVVSYYLTKKQVGGLMFLKLAEKIHNIIELSKLYAVLSNIFIIIIWLETILSQVGLNFLYRTNSSFILHLFFQKDDSQVSGCIQEFYRDVRFNQMEAFKI